MSPTSVTTLTLQEAADQLGVHYMTAYRYVRLGLLDARKIGGAWQVGLDAIEVFQSGSGHGPVAAGGSAPWAERFESRLVEGDAHGAWLVVESAMTSGADARNVYIEMLSPAMVRIGERWKLGELDIAVEHQATGIVTRIISRLGPRFVRRGRPRGGLVLGAPSGETHAMTSAIVSDLMRLHGWAVNDLGANTPGSAFIYAANAASDLRGIGISVTAATSLDATRAACSQIRAALPAVPIVLGGLAIESNEHARSIGAHAGAFGADEFHKFLVHTR